MNILFLDTETTGLNPKENSLIEIAAEFHVDGARKTFFTASCSDKSAVVDMAALKVNKKSLADIQSYKNEEEVLRHLTDFLVRLDSKEPIIICGHNVHFDVQFLKTRLEKYNIVGWDSAVSYRHLDTCVLARFLLAAGLLPAELGPRGSSLKAIAEALKVNTKDVELHTAHGDVILTARVFYKLVEVFKSLNTEFGRILYGEN